MGQSDANEPLAGAVSLGDINSVRSWVQHGSDLVDTSSLQPGTAGMESLRVESDGLFFDLGHFAAVRLGTPPVTFRLQLDTSSADIWVPCEACPMCGRRARLGPDTSSSFVETNQPWSITYSSSFLFSGLSALTNVSGTTANDTLSLAGLKLNNMTIGTATFVENEYSVDWLPYDGVLGLGNSLVFPSLSLQHAMSPIVQMAHASLIPRAQVGIAIGRGQLALGGIASNLLDSSMTVQKSVSPLGYWEIPFDIAVSGRADGTFWNRTAILDTRSSTILAPVDDLAELGLSTDDNGRVLLPCYAPGLLIMLTTAGHSFSISPTNLILMPLTDTSCDSPPCCLSALQPAPPALGLQAGQWILGKAFLKDIYLGLDFDANMVGLASVKSDGR